MADLIDLLIIQPFDLSKLKSGRLKRILNYLSTNVKLYRHTYIFLETELRKHDDCYLLHVESGIRS